MSRHLDSFARSFALVGALGALLDGNQARARVAPREQSPGFSRRLRASIAKGAHPSTHALASAAHVRDDRTSLAA
jgi:hypothetical protein